MNAGTPDYRHTVPLRPLKAIRARCLDCCAGSSHEVRQCVVYACALWPYRLGKRPVKPSTPHERGHSGANATEVDLDLDRDSSRAETLPSYASTPEPRRVKQ
jgi:hypothetical protein